MPATDGWKNPDPRRLRAAAALPCPGQLRAGPGHLRARRGRCCGVYPQVGYAIGKHCGNAVVRNSLRRRMRESARAVAAHAPPGDLSPPGRACGRPERARAFVCDVQRALQRRRALGAGYGRGDRDDGASAPGPGRGPGDRGLSGLRHRGRISPCRFYPSCSNYAMEAFTEHGFWRGLALTARSAWSVAGRSGRTALTWCLCTSTPGPAPRSGRIR